ncbi:molecular chaperone Hsp70 [Sorangium cellulosum]|uniref:Molecular chaperone Hsp70 n=1 Tax=Sorangium cellulosum TaxID=56 RepID=A0A4P2Q1U5_SORCE|nr:Hsp70 family protein [Sorangium cellulosum]AUX23209.1 molecular chaperone Hsp70 [Sorangium cellulosum]
MRLGIDFGTTRTVVACCDRGNYPVLSFQDAAGDPVDFYPSVVAERGGELRFGLDALAVASDPAWSVLRSFKRVLSGPGASPDLEVAIGGTRLRVLDLLTLFLKSLRDAVLHRSNRPKKRQDDERLICVVATPANAHGTQRFVTLDAFRRAGFEVIALLNEPSAAGFEYTHRYRSTITSKREHIVVYDLGGGTFDASLVHMTGRSHDAVATAGLNHLGGDDFDAALASAALAAAGLEREALPARALAALADQCREAKERLNPNTRRIVIDLEACLGDRAPAPEVTIPAADYYDRCAPLVESTITAMQPVIARLDAGAGEALADIAGIYVVGGASSLPIVARTLRERFGRRVHRSPYPSAAIAMGLAIAVDEDAGFELSDRLSRHFGVFREGGGGSEVIFDPIFDREARVPSSREAPVVSRRVYRAAHNVGRYRFVECATLDRLGVPHGDITAFNEVVFPFDRQLRDRSAELAAVPVRRMGDEGPLIEEQYAITPHGIVEVTITDVEAGYRRVYQVGA